jgi:ribose 5-phosphate isomerase A
MDPKQLVGRECLRFIRSDMVVGLGTGSTARHFVNALAEAIAAGRLSGIRGIPTSKRTEDQARTLGIPLTSLADCPGGVDVTIDGADEIAPGLMLIKGLGGALLREKVIAQNSRTMIVIADAGKESSGLGIKSPLPVEVVPFEHAAAERFLRAQGCEPTLRRTPDGATYVTDNGNYIYDCRFAAPIIDPAGLEARLASRAGIVESGLFLGIATIALIADAAGVRERTA